MKQDKREMVERYNYRPIHLHIYIMILILIPISIKTSFNRELTVLILFASFLMKLSTYWNIKSLLIQCYSYNINGEYLFYQDTLCRLVKIKEGFKFIFNNNIYLLISGKIEKLKFYECTSNEIINLKIKHDKYDIYPNNKIIIKRDSFFELLFKQCISPMFCFQIFTSILQIFDDYFYQPLLGIFFNIVTEIMMTVNKMVTVKMMGQYKKTASRKFKLLYFGNDYRNIKKLNVSQEKLKTGDIIEIKEGIIPCDLIIKSGSCVVNESILSGESVPIIKNSILMDVSINKNNILYSGTEIETVTENLVCYVKNTGYYTEQGKLLNTIIKSEDITYDKEALKFVIIMSIIGLINSLLLPFFSKKKGYQLLLDMIILFTNSIPIELPIEMGISLQSAVKECLSKKIYCTESYRIGLAGKLDVCCFDKTGTLTNSDVEINSIIYDTEYTNKILSFCNSLIFNSDLEKLTVDDLKGDILDKTIALHLNKLKQLFEYEVIKNYGFSSELKRQTVVVKENDKYLIGVKGAPEVIIKHLKEIPHCYEDYKEYARRGYRIISIAYKVVESFDKSPFDYELIEDLIFDGFILFNSSLKPYAKEMCKILRNSKHKVVMITGDNKLTAMNIAEKLRMKPVGVEGENINEILKSDTFMKFNVFARASPNQKELIIRKYKELNKCVMMVGDGSNDISALKISDVGVSIIDGDQTKNNESTDLNNNLIIYSSPFTVKSNSLKSIIEIIQQGRLSAITTLQMYKIIALNSLISVFITGIIDLYDVRFTEKQSVAMGLLNTIAFNSISRGKVLKYISKGRVITSIFTKYVINSIVSQSLLHLIVFLSLLFYFNRNSNSIVINNLDVLSNFNKEIKKENVDGKDLVLNNLLFLLNIFQVISIYTFNYIGAPFRENLFENNILFLTLLGLISVGVCGIFNVIPDINQLLSLTDLRGFKGVLLGLSFILLIVTYFIEYFNSKYFMIKK